MRVLLSTIGSRGDVQPLVALALALKELGQDVHLCVPPDFRAWIEGLGMPVTPIGPELKSTGKAGVSVSPPSPEQLRQMAEASVAAQFETVAEAARGCDAIVAATTLQTAARSVAEAMGIPYVFTAYCPAVLPSPHHAPPVLGLRGDAPASAPAEWPGLWKRDAERFNATFGAALNQHRASLGLSPVDDVRGHILTERPWLACDPVLGPWPGSPELEVFQPGAWFLPDDRPLAAELEAFLDAGEPPIYFGFGSIRAPEGLGRAMVASARALGRRTILSRGWADLSPEDDGADCLSIGEVNQRALFRRVAAVVHHGGAGTTTAAAISAAPQVIIPQMYDQHYFAERVQQLGIGTAHPSIIPTVDSLSAALAQTLRPEVASRAQSIAEKMPRDGARIAAQRLIDVVG